MFVVIAVQCSSLADVIGAFDFTVSVFACGKERYVCVVGGGGGGREGESVCVCGRERERERERERVKWGTDW